jgi:hypothetical protein
MTPACQPGRTVDLDYALLSPEEIESLYAAFDRLHAGEEASEDEELWELVAELIDYVMENTRGFSS